jgi:hypothetical protein
MVEVQSRMISESSDIAESGLAVSGRSRLYGAVFANAETYDVTVSAPPYIEFKNGSNSGDLLFTMSNCPGGCESNYVAGTTYIDLPSGGILFEDGIYVNIPASTQEARICILFQGGSSV